MNIGLKPIRVSGGKFLRWFAVIGDALYPARCMACRSLFRPAEYQRSITQDEILAGIDWDSGQTFQFLNDGHSTSRLFDRIMFGFVCSACRSDLRTVVAPYCSCCGLVFKSRFGENHLCGDCIENPKYFKRARAFGIYAGCLVALTQAYKYSGKIQLAKPIGALLLATVRKHWSPDDMDLILPVPLNKRRLRQRGFNQAYLPIRHWSTLAGNWPWRLPGRIRTDVVERHVQTEPQASIGRKERVANVKNAFRVVQPSKIREKRILLIDDVYTTGATVNECARILLQEGAAAVDVLTLARAI